MNITTKQLMDIVSLSVMAVNMENDPTLPAHMDKFFGNSETSLVTPVENEVKDILGDEHDLKTKVEIIKIAKALNQHIAAIRLGKEIAKQPELIQFV